MPVRVQVDTAAARHSTELEAATRARDEAAAACEAATAALGAAQASADASRLYLTCISAVSHLHLGCISAAQASADAAASDRDEFKARCDAALAESADATSAKEAASATRTRAVPTAPRAFRAPCTAPLHEHVIRMHSVDEACIPCAVHR